MFGKKKKKLFGNTVEPDCSYCAHGLEHGCELNRGDRPCGEFRYDPLKRVPAQTPPPKRYDPEDFKL